MIVLCGKMKERSYVDVKQVPFLKGEFPLKMIEFSDCARSFKRRFKKNVRRFKRLPGGCARTLTGIIVKAYNGKQGEY